MGFFQPKSGNDSVIDCSISVKGRNLAAHSGETTKQVRREKLSLMSGTTKDEESMTPDGTTSTGETSTDGATVKLEGDDEAKPVAPAGQSDVVTVKDDDDDDDDNKDSNRSGADEAGEQTTGDGEDDNTEGDKSTGDGAKKEEEKKEDDDKAKEPAKKKYTNWPLRNVKEPHENDVLFGRGGGTNHHPGNKRYRKMVEDRKLDYVNSKRLDKPLVALEIIRIWRAQDPPGRFLKLDEKTGLWTDVGDKKAREKTSQALREKAPLLRKSMEDDALLKSLKEKNVSLDPANRRQPDGTEDEDMPDVDPFSPSADSDPNSKRTTFSLTEEELERMERKKSSMTRPKLARDHSLGQEILDPSQALSIDGFSWGEDGGGKKATLAAAAPPPPPPPRPGSGTVFGAPRGTEGWGSGAFAEVGDLGPRSPGSHGSASSSSMGPPQPPPPPPPPAAFRSGSGKAVDVPPAYETMVGRRERSASRQHTFSMHPLPGADTGQAAPPNPFDVSSTGRSNSGGERAWGGTTGSFPPYSGVGGNGEVVRSSSRNNSGSFPPKQPRFLNNEGSSAFSRTPSASNRPGSIPHPPPMPHRTPSALDEMVFRSSSGRNSFSNSDPHRRTASSSDMYVDNVSHSWTGGGSSPSPAQTDSDDFAKVASMFGTNNRDDGSADARQSWQASGRRENAGEDYNRQSYQGGDRRPSSARSAMDDSYPNNRRSFSNLEDEMPGRISREASGSYQNGPYPRSASFEFGGATNNGGPPPASGIPPKMDPSTPQRTPFNQGNVPFGGIAADRKPAILRRPPGGMAMSTTSSTVDDMSSPDANLTKPSLRRKLSGGGVTPQSPEVSPARNSMLPRPHPVKRETSHQNENTETKRSVKRSVICREHSLQTSDLGPSYTVYDDIPNNVFQDDSAMRNLQTSTSQISLGLGASRRVAANRTLEEPLPLEPEPDHHEFPKPEPVSAEHRSSTVEAILADFPKDTFPRMEGVSKEGRSSTIEALQLDFDLGGGRGGGAGGDAGGLPKPSAWTAGERVSTADSLALEFDPEMAPMEPMESWNDM